jgi:hypothetical protein
MMVAMMASASSVPSSATRIMRIQSANAVLSVCGVNTLIDIYRSKSIAVWKQRLNKSWHGNKLIAL